MARVVIRRGQIAAPPRGLPVGHFLSISSMRVQTGSDTRGITDFSGQVINRVVVGVFYSIRAEVKCSRCGWGWVVVAPWPSGRGAPFLLDAAGRAAVEAIVYAQAMEQISDKGCAKGPHA